MPGRAHHQIGGSWEATGRERGILQLCLLLSAGFQGHSALRVAEDPGWGVLHCPAAPGDRGGGLLPPSHQTLGVKVLPSLFGWGVGIGL